MRSYFLPFFVGLLSFSAGVAWAADASQPAAEPSQPAVSAPAGAPESAELQGPAQLPAPLDKIACNIAELAQTGYFELSPPTLGHAEDFGDEALIWTVKVLKPLSCRHATILLRSFSDVRFYHSEEDTIKELYSTSLVYSTRVAEGAVNGEILQRDHEFQAWVVISLRHLDVLVRQQADTIEFGRPQVVRVHPLSPSTMRWTSAGTGIPRWFSKRQEPFRLPK